MNITVLIDNLLKKQKAPTDSIRNYCKKTMGIQNGNRGKTNFLSINKLCELIVYPHKIKNKNKDIF